MKSSILWWLLAYLHLCCLTATAQSHPAVLTGHIEPDPDWDQTIYLCKIPGYATLFSGYDGLIVESATLAPDGTFAFSVNAEDPAIYRLNIPKVGDAAKAGMYFGLPFENYIHLVLEPGAHVQIRSKANQLTQQCQITGSADNMAMQAVRDLRTPMLKQVPQLMEAMTRAQQEAPETLEQVQENVMQQLRLAAEDVQRQLENFMDSTTSLYAGLLAAAYYRLDDNYANYLPTYERVTPKWLQAHGENTYLGELLSEMDEFQFS